ncbi:MAG TPA: histidinol-phosphate transaminase [Planctomycetaceae bacterium]|nr:histidinol-phosphate transaminase [Planctomycetaceae bacterium]
MTLPFRPAVNQMRGYVPGEQPQDDGWTKLNTNENPYPPSPKVVEAIQAAATGRLNIYPDATATEFREAAAELFGVTPDWILAGNGSDENLTILIRSFCDPGSQIVYPYPSYVLYESLAAIQGCSVSRLLLRADLSWDSSEAAELSEAARLVFVPNPNSPTGNLWSADELQQLLPRDGILVLDEAYADFADSPHSGELLREERFAQRMVVTRTFSKSYSLAGIRFGFSVADPELTGGMHKVRDSYNCDAVATAAATAAIRDQDWMLANRRKVLATRVRLATALAELGFNVTPSQANFIWCQHPSGRHQQIYEALKERKILVRFMQFAGVRAESGLDDGLRITVGTDEQTDLLLAALTTIMPEQT